MGSIALLAAISVANAFMATQNRPPRVPVAAADMSCDCAVIGAGPAGSVMAWLLAERGDLSVALVDPNLDKPWPNNCNGRCPKAPSTSDRGSSDGDLAQTASGRPSSTRSTP